MRKILYVIIVVLLLAAPVKKLDVANLEPVEVVYVQAKGKGVTLTTDTKAKGQGETVRKALEDMKNNTAGVIYLDTAEYLLIDEGAAQIIGEMRELLHDSVKLCRAEEPDMEIAAEYLENHGDLPRLKHWEKDMKLPTWENEKNIKKEHKNA